MVNKKNNSNGAGGQVVQVVVGRGELHLLLVHVEAACSPVTNLAPLRLGQQAHHLVQPLPQDHHLRAQRRALPLQRLLQERGGLSL
jgi:hypothetical protein